MLHGRGAELVEQGRKPALGSLAECDTQLIIAEQLGYGTYAKKLKAAIMALTMGIRAYGKTLKPSPPAQRTPDAG